MTASRSRIPPHSTPRFGKVVVECVCAGVEDIALAIPIQVDRFNARGPERQIGRQPRGGAMKSSLHFTYLDSDGYQVLFVA